MEIAKRVLGSGVVYPHRATKAHTALQESKALLPREEVILTQEDKCHPSKCVPLSSYSSTSLLC